MTLRYDFHYDDFTETNYRRLLKIAIEAYKFVPFKKFDVEGELCLWRHDVDYSLHRARHLASIEAEMGISTTYFLNIHSEYFSVLGESSSEIIRDIVRMGHHIGLHLDAGFYDYRQWSFEERLAILRNEKNILEMLFDLEVGCYSIHNPTEVDDWNSKETVLEEMVNVYCEEIMGRYVYVSDSNGIWAKSRLEDILISHPPKLQVLTHPEWWTPDAMSPRDRISRCIDGRAMCMHQAYDQSLLEFMRPNVGQK